MKTCSGCSKSKCESEFHKNKSRSDGRSHYCKTCVKKKTSSKNKKCHICNKTKKLIEFYSQTSRCKVCDKTDKSKLKDIEKLCKILEATKVQILHNKKCDICNKTRDIEDFPRKGTNLDGCGATYSRCIIQSKHHKMTESEKEFNSGIDRMEIMYLKILDEIKQEQQEQKREEI